MRSFKFLATPFNIMQRACILREIAQDTDKFRQAMHLGSLEGIPSSRTSSLSFNLPAIPDIQPQLIEVGLPRHLARALYLSYCDKASRHRLRTLRQMNRLADLPGMSSDNAIRTLATIFSKQLEEWRDQAISCVHTRSSPTQLICKQMRTSFDPVRLVVWLSCLFLHLYLLILEMDSPPQKLL